jgi:hypothetical protein
MKKKNTLLWILIATSMTGCQKMNQKPVPSFEKNLMNKRIVLPANKIFIHNKVREESLNGFLTDQLSDSHQWIRPLDELMEAWLNYAMVSQKGDPHEIQFTIEDAVIKTTPGKIHDTIHLQGKINVQYKDTHEKKSQTFSGSVTHDIPSNSSFQERQNEKKSMTYNMFNQIHDDIQSYYKV